MKKKRWNRQNRKDKEKKTIIKNTPTKEPPKLFTAKPPTPQPTNVKKTGKETTKIKITK